MALRRTRLHKLLLLALSTGLSLLAVEGAVRLRQQLRYGSTEAEVLEFQQDEQHGVRVLVPGSTMGPIHVNSRGLRGPEIDLPKPVGRLRVAFLGGSTTFCAEVSSDEATWPALVAADLAEALAPRQVDHVNAGVPGWTTAESRGTLDWRIAPLEPDAIVIYHATNDLTRHARALAKELGHYDARAHDDEPSWLGERSLAWRLVEKNLHQKTVLAADEQLDLDVERLAEPFRDELRALIAEARALTPVVCLVTFSHRGRLDQDPAVLRANSTSSLYNMPFLGPERIAEAFESYNRVLREVAAETGVLLVEGEHTIPPDGEHFGDSIHFTDRGARLQADRVLEVLVPALEGTRGDDRRP